MPAVTKASSLELAGAVVYIVLSRTTNQEGPLCSIYQGLRGAQGGWPHPLPLLLDSFTHLTFRLAFGGASPPLSSRALPQRLSLLSSFGFHGLSYEWVELSCLPWMLILSCMLICRPSALQHAHSRARRVETCTTVGSPTSAILSARRPALHASPPNNLSLLYLLIPRRSYFLPPAFVLPALKLEKGPLDKTAGSLKQGSVPEVYGRERLQEQHGGAPKHFRHSACLSVCLHVRHANAHTHNHMRMITVVLQNVFLQIIKQT